MLKLNKNVDWTIVRAFKVNLGHKKVVLSEHSGQSVTLFNVIPIEEIDQKKFDDCKNSLRSVKNILHTDEIC